MTDCHVNFQETTRPELLSGCPFKAELEISGEGAWDSHTSFPAEGEDRYNFSLICFFTSILLNNSQNLLFQLNYLNFLWTLDFWIIKFWNKVIIDEPKLN